VSASRPPRARPVGATRRALGRPGARACLLVLGLWIAAGAVGPELATSGGIAAPRAVAVILLGARASALMVALALGLALPGGLLLGVVAGAGGRARDGLLARSIELGSFWPAVVLVPLLGASLALPPPLALGLAVALSEGCRVARLVRSEVLRARAAPWAVAARALGATRVDLFLHHVLPHAAGPFLVAAAFVAATTIAVDTAVAFLGLVEASPLSWGGALAASLEGGAIALGPLLAALATTVACYGIAGALEAELDPRPPLSPPARAA